MTDVPAPEIAQTFTHRFGGWRDAPARRWRNPDGSEGGIVAVSAAVDPSARLQPGVEVWPGAKIGYRASIGSGASIGDCAKIGYRASIGSGASIGDRAKIGDGASIGSGTSIGPGTSIGARTSIEAEDWLFVAGPQGSRHAFATAVGSRVHSLRWWVGCQHGLTTDQLFDRVAREHGDTPHGEDYRALIAFVVGHPGWLRKQAEWAAEDAKASESTAGLEGDNG